MTDQEMTDLRVTPRTDALRQICKDEGDSKTQTIKEAFGLCEEFERTAADLRDRLAKFGAAELPPIPPLYGTKEFPVIHADEYKKLRTFAQAQAAMADLRAKVITDANNILATYIVPDSGISDHECINKLLGLLDGPQTRAALLPAPKADDEG